MPRALLSVSDKRGVVPFAQGLVNLGWDILSTGGTADALKRAGVPCMLVEELTQFPEMLDGRVKTLHPMVHAGLLARRDLPAHAAAMMARGIPNIDLVAVNLYPFRETISRDVRFEEAIEQIDVGGPAMLRSAAKNHAFVLPIVDPTDYGPTLDGLRNGTITPTQRREYAAKVFAHLADYDAVIARYLTSETEALPPRLTLTMERLQALRYGENPEQRGALYVTEEPRGMQDLVQRQGKELSFNNLLDVDAASAAVAPWIDQIACAIIKHTTPCGVAVAGTAVEAFMRARATDPQSAFGGIVAFNTVVTREAAVAMKDLFIEVIVAPRFHDDALEVLAQRKSLRVVELPLDLSLPALDFKRVRGGFLVQDRARAEHPETGWQLVTKREPSDREWRDLRFAWSAIASVKSNAILLARDEQAIGIGAGQMSRVDSVFLAVHKAQKAGHALAGSALASDAYFPFADGIEEAARAGVSAVIQPGGSIRDAEVIAAADHHDIAMVFTGRRLFRH